MKRLIFETSEDNNDDDNDNNNDNNDDCKGKRKCFHDMTFHAQLNSVEISRGTPNVTFLFIISTSHS